MKKNRKVCASVLTALLIAAIPVMAFGADVPETTTLNDATQSIAEDPNLGFSQFMDDFNDALSQSQFSNDSLFDVSATVGNFQMLNMQYEVLSLQMQENGFGETASLDMPEFQTGYTTDTQSLFREAYGDIAKNAKLEEPTIPESFNVSQMMQEASANREAALGDFKSSSMYQTTVGSISIGNVFSEASKVKTMPELLSADAMASGLSSLSQEAQAFVKENAPSVDLDALLEEYKAAANPNAEGSTAAENKAAAMNAFDNYKSEFSSYFDTLKVVYTFDDAETLFGSSNTELDPGGIHKASERFEAYNNMDNPPEMSINDLMNMSDEEFSKMISGE